VLELQGPLSVLSGQITVWEPVTLAERGVYAEAQPGKVPSQRGPFCMSSPTVPWWVRQPALNRMHQIPQLGAGSSACASPDTHTQPHSFYPWGREWGEGRQGHPYQEALLAESHLAVGWLSQQLRQQG